MVSVKFILRKMQKTILTMNIKIPRRSIYGQLDIILDSAARNAFLKTVAGDYYMQFENEIYAVSWHGYYEHKNGKVSLPTIHFKDNSNLYQQYKNPTHIGTINSLEPFAFPMCSLFVPKENHWLEAVNVSKYDAANIEYHYKDIDSNVDQRVDIFITPKDVRANKILDSDLGYLYKLADITLFNTKEGRFIPIKESIGNVNGVYSNYIDIYNLSCGHDLIVRTVGNQGNKFCELEGTYSLLVHDPNDAFNRMANRLVLHYNEENGDIERVGTIKEGL